MKIDNKKLEDLVLSIYAVCERLDIPFEEAHGLFMSGDIFVSHYCTRKPLHPSDYSEFRTISQEARAMIFNNRPRRQVRKTRDQVSDTCKICRLLRRANQLKNELFEIDRQLNETYGIVLSSESLLLHNVRSSFRTLRPGNSKMCSSCSRYGKSSGVQENFSPSSRDVSEPFDYQRILDQL